MNSYQVQSFTWHERQGEGESWIIIRWWWDDQRWECLGSWTRALLTMRWAEVNPFCPTVCFSIPDCFWIKQSQKWKVLTGYFCLISFLSNSLSCLFISIFKVRSEQWVVILISNGFCPTYWVLHLHSRNVFALDWRLSSSVVNKGFWSIKRKPPMWLLHI